VTGNVITGVTRPTPLARLNDLWRLATPILEVQRLDDRFQGVWVRRALII